MTLWRSRRRDAWRYLRRAGARRRRPAGLRLRRPPGRRCRTSSVHVARDAVPAPHLGAPHEDVTLTTSDGLTLKGWYVPSRNGAAVIAFPGRKGPQPHARMLIRHGYGVLLLDRRGEGESEGDPSTRGWGGARDLHAAVAYLQRRPDVERGRIGGLGLSVGGEMMIEAAASTPGLKAVASEGAGIRSVRELLDTPGAPEVVARPVHGDRDRGDGRLLQPARRRPTSATSWRRSRRARCCSCTPASGQGGEIELNPVFHRRAGATLDAVGDPGRRPRRRHPRPARGVRAPRRRLLRRRAALARGELVHLAVGRAPCRRASASILVPWRMRSLLVWSNVTSTTSSGRSAIHSSSRALFQRLGSPMPRSPVS